METTSVNGVVFFDPSDKIYKDHFPSEPIVPGTVIINALCQAAQKITSGKLLEINRFRFKRFVSPGTYEYKLILESNKIRACLYNQNEIIAEGFLVYDTIVNKTK